MNIRSIKIVLFFFSIILGSCSVTKHSKSHLIWEDNFDNQTAFNTKYWSKIPRGSSDWNRHMSNDDSLFVVSNGNLILRGMVNPDLSGDTSRYITGGVYTKSKVSFGFGRWEIRAKLHGAKGAWPAFWLLPEGGKWPDAGEIDIMEHLNYDSIAYQTVHNYYTYTLKMSNNPPHGATGKINLNDYNTYAVELYPDSLVFFINNKKTFTYPRIKTNKEGQFPFDKHQYYLLVDMQLGGNWVGGVDPKDLPVEMEIDWVRFYGFGNKKLQNK